MRSRSDSGTVFITGGAGFIGSNLVRFLLRRFAVRVFDNTPGRSHYDVEAAGAELFAGDIRDLDILLEAVHGCETIVHLAASGSVVDSVREPFANFQHNVLGTLQVLRAAKDASVKRVIIASTGGALIGEALPPVDEQALPRPISPYGASKLCCEAYGHAFHKAYNLDVIALRFANIYGPWSWHKKGVVTTFIKSLMNGHPLTVFGNGNATRDFLHVDDLCEGIYRAVTTPGIGGEIFHLASGTETRIGDLAKILSNIAGRPQHPVRYEHPRVGEVGRNFAAYDKAARILEYTPQIQLTEGLRRTYDWFCRNAEIFS